MRSSRLGFTLLELVIAIMILTFVTVFTAQAIQKALQNRAKIQRELDESSSLRDALKVMENDINKAFNYRDINIELYNETAKERNRKIQEAKSKGAQPQDPNNPAPAPGQAPPTTTADPYANMEPMKEKQEKILTHFMGESDSLNFTSLSNMRISSEERSSDQAEIGYFVRECKSRKHKDSNSRCLVRRVSTIIDDDVTTGGEETSLLEDVTSFELRYLGPIDPTQWQNTWYTNERADERSRGVFPYAVEITLEVRDSSLDKAKPLRMTVVAAVRNPNNPEPKTETAEPGQNAPAPAAPGGGG